MDFVSKNARLLGTTEYVGGNYSVITYGDSDLRAYSILVFLAEYF